MMTPPRIQQPKILEAKNIVFAYGHDEMKTPILHGVSLDVYQGEILAIKGPSGSGKTTLLHLLGCLMTMQQGDLFIDDINVSALDNEQLALFRHAKIGFVFQKFFLLPRTSVLDNILLATVYPAEFAKKTSKQIEKAITIATTLGIQHRLEHTPSELSGGEQQRVAIARALMNNASLLFADEPTGNLDSKSSQVTLDLFKELNAKGQTVIIITHDDNVARQAHRIVNIKDGKIESIEVIRPHGSYDQIENQVHPQITSNDGTSNDGTTNDETSNDETSNDGTSNDGTTQTNPSNSKNAPLSATSNQHNTSKDSKDRDSKSKVLTSYADPSHGDHNHPKSKALSLQSSADQNISSIKTGFSQQGSTGEKPYYLRTYRPFTHIFRLFINLTPIALASLFRNKTRTILTMLGIVIGISAMLILMTVGQFAKQTIVASFQTLGATSVSIYGFPNDPTSNPPTSSTNNNYRQAFTEFDVLSDLDPLPTIFPSIEYVSPVIDLGHGTKVSYGGVPVNQAITANGVGPDYFKMLHLTLLQGRYLRYNEVQQGSNVCVIGNDIYKQLFSNRGLTAIGKSITLTPSTGTSFGCLIIGVLKHNDVSFVRDPNYIVFLSYKYLKDNTSFLWYKMIHNFVFSTYNPNQVINTSKSVSNFFKQKYGSTGFFMISPLTQVINFFGTVLGLVTLLLALVAAISLIVAGVGVANMMLASIVERLKEIGLIKALGATNFSIRILFLLESLFLALIAGIIGIVIGFVVYELMIYAITKFMSSVPFDFYFVWYAYVVSIGSMILVGVFSGLLPAFRAEKIDVVEALTSE